jgi:hypothetical protein
MMVWPMLFSLLLLLPIVLGDNSAILSINASTSPANVPASFVCVTTDWWTKNDPNFGVKWGSAGVGTLNLEDESFRQLVSQLKPASWRVGGTPADYVLYQRADGSWPTGCPPIGGGVGGPIPNVPICLSRSRWEQICKFAREMQFGHFYFGLNALYGRANNSSPMNMSLIDSLVHHSHSIGCPVSFFELGNELGSGEGSVAAPRVQAATLASDINRLSVIVNKYYSSNNVGLAGPDWVPAKWQGDVLGATEALDEATTHIYGLSNGPCSVGNISSVHTARSYKSQIDSMMSYTHSVSKRQDIGNTCGECGPCWGGGKENVTNSFADFAWYLTGLGYGAQQGMLRFCRSTLIGGSYELIDHKTMTPNPDYWVALLWTRLIGQSKSFTPILSKGSPDTLVAYALCSRQRSGGLVAILLNTDSEASVEVAFEWSTSGALVWALQAPKGDLSSRSACIVRNPSSCTILTDASQLEPMQMTGESYTLRPKSYAYIVFPNAQYGKCM